MAHFEAHFDCRFFRSDLQAPSAKELLKKRKKLLKQLESGAVDHNHWIQRLMEEHFKARYPKPNYGDFYDDEPLPWEICMEQAKAIFMTKWITWKYVQTQQKRHARLHRKPVPSFLRRFVDFGERAFAPARPPGIS